MTAYTLPVVIQSAIKTVFHTHLDANKGGISSTVSIADEIKSATGARRNEIATAVFNAFRQEYAEASTSLTKAEQTAAGSAWNACRKNLDTNLKSRFLVVEWPAIKTGNRKDGSKGCLVHDTASYEAQKTREAEETAKEIDALALLNKANRAQAELQAWREKTPYDAAMEIYARITAYSDDAQFALFDILKDKMELLPIDFDRKYNPNDVERIDLPEVAELRAMLDSGQITEEEYQAMAA
jgi:hypothetical protein